MSLVTSFSADVLRIDAATVAGDLQEFLRDSVLHQLRRKGIVVGLSGGIDSSVVAALAARALGPDSAAAAHCSVTDATCTSR